MVIRCFWLQDPFSDETLLVTWYLWRRDIFCCEIFLVLRSLGWYDNLPYETLLWMKYFFRRVFLSDTYVSYYRNESHITYFPLVIVFRIVDQDRNFELYHNYPDLVMQPNKNMVLLTTMHYWWSAVCCWYMQLHHFYIQQSALDK